MRYNDLMSKFAGFRLIPFLAVLGAAGGGALGTSCDPATIKIMPLGDSITAGLTVIQGVHTLNGGYRRKLERLLDSSGVHFDFVGSQTDPADVAMERKHHEGHSGWRIQDIDAHVDEWVTPTQPQVILLLIGANDIYQRNDLQNAPSRFSALLDHLRRDDPGVWIFASSILPMQDPLMNAEAETYNAAIGDLVVTRQNQGEKIRWVDVSGRSGLTPTFADLPDGLHPDRPGYDRIAQVWFDALSDFLTP